MKGIKRTVCLLLALISVALLLSGCAERNLDKWILGSWEFKYEYRYSGVLDCTITFLEDNTIKRTGISDQGGNYYIMDGNRLKLLVGSGSFEIFEYDYDLQKGREKGSGCWCMINKDRMFIDGEMYKRIK